MNNIKKLELLGQPGVMVEVVDNVSINAEEYHKELIYTLVLNYECHNGLGLNLDDIHEVKQRLIDWYLDDYDFNRVNNQICVDVVNGKLFDTIEVITKEIKEKKKKYYKVVVDFNGYYTVYVKANTEEEATEYANNMSVSETSKFVSDAVELYNVDYNSYVDETTTYPVEDEEEYVELK